MDRLVQFSLLFKLQKFPRNSPPAVHFYMHDWIQTCQYLIISVDGSGEDHDLLIAVIEDHVGSHELTRYTLDRTGPWNLRKAC